MISTNENVIWCRTDERLTSLYPINYLYLYFVCILEMFVSKD
jgi:hypothetical protein